MNRAFSEILIKSNSCNKGQSLIGIIVVLVVVGLISGGLYFYLSKQIPEVPEITKKPTEEEAVKPEEEITPPPEEKLAPPKKEKPAEKLVVQKCTDGTLCSQCSTDKPKYCDGGILIDRTSLCGCPAGYKTINEQCFLLLDTDEIIIFKEQKQSEFLRFSGEKEIWYIVSQYKLLERFYQTYGDVYDFIALFPTKKLRFNFSHVVNRDIAGIGQDNKITSPYTKKLKSLVILDSYRSWDHYRSVGIDSQVSETSVKKILIHEIGHRWLAYIHGVVSNKVPTHWPNNIDLFNGDPQYVDIMGYYQWIIKNGEEICVNINSSNITPKFSNLSLYLMGLIPAEQVSSIYVHEFEESPDYTYLGPTCDQEPKFTKTKTITIQDIIEANGERRPSYQESQKDFRIAFVILTEKDTDVPSDFIRYIDEYKQALPEAWNQVTDGKSNISF